MTSWLPDPADDVLAALQVDLQRAGVVADRMPACKLIYLAVTSRVFDRPVSVLVKGPSSAGKSWMTDRVLDLCPPSAYYRLSSSSPKAIAFDPEPLQHRMLVLSESQSIKDGDGAYLIRTLLSEAMIRHSTVSTGSDGKLRSQVVEKQGPKRLARVRPQPRDGRAPRRNPVWPGRGGADHRSGVAHPARLDRDHQPDQGARAAASALARA